jgi:polyisoprenyl-phosphate glycosyltransferase
MVEISVVSPIYGTPDLIPVLCSRVKSALQSLSVDYELVLVFDCSPDDGWSRIQEECRTDARVKGVKLSRNFGQHAAITAGLESAAGKWIVIMDCDLQDMPEEIPHLYQVASEGYDIVLAQRSIRVDGFLRKAVSSLFYRVLGYLTDSELDASIANFGIYHRKVINAMLSMKDKTRFFPMMVQWVGFKSKKLPVKHAKRELGKTNYTWSALFKLAFSSMLAFSDKPLRLTVGLGMCMSSITVLIGCFYLLRYLAGGITVSGFASLILSIWFLSGIIIFILGIVGLYLARVFQQVKDRPVYIVDEKENFR